MHWSDVLLLRLPLAIWVGGTIIAVVSAPFLFALIPSRDVAGDVFGRILARLGAIEHGLSLALVLGVFSAAGREGKIIGRSAVTAVAIFLAIATNVYSSMVLRPKMRYYRTQTGSFDAVPDDNPWRRRFNALHRRATTVTLAGLLCAVTALCSGP